MCVIPIVWMFRKREKRSIPPMLPRSFPNSSEEKLRLLEQYINDYESFCVNSTTHDVPDALKEVKDLLYSARYGGVNVDDLEAKLRSVLS